MFHFLHALGKAVPFLIQNGIQTILILFMRGLPTHALGKFVNWLQASSQQTSRGKDEKHAYEIGRFLLRNLGWHRNKKHPCYAMCLVVIPLQPHAQVAAPGLLMTIGAKLQLQGMHLVLQLQRLRGQLLVGSLD